jgi:hypothetical protein
MRWFPWCPGIWISWLTEVSVRSVEPLYQWHSLDWDKDCMFSIVVVAPRACKDIMNSVLKVVKSALKLLILRWVVVYDKYKTALVSDPHHRIAPNVMVGYISGSHLNPINYFNTVVAHRTWVQKAPVRYLARSSLVVLLSVSIKKRFWHSSILSSQNSSEKTLK